MTEPELRILAINKVRECKLIAENKLKITLPKITVSFDLHVPERAGEAGIGWYKGKPVNASMRLNPKFLVSHTAYTIEQTIPHEMSHLVADFYYRRRCMHGWQWKHVAETIYNIPPNEFHTMDAQGWTVTCSYCNHAHHCMSNAQKIGIQNYPQNYVCAYCKNFFNGTEKICLTRDYERSIKGSDNKSPAP